jgi:hypothetical protein
MSLPNLSISPIVSPSGEALFSVGGKNSYKTAIKHGFVVSLEWIRLGKHIRAAMCIWPASNVFVTGEGKGIWTITRNCITDFVGFNKDGTCTGGPSDHCFREAREALSVLGKDPNDKGALFELVDVVVTFAPDLVLMPATPKHVRKQLDPDAMWEVTATNKDTGKVLSEATV